MSKVLNKFKSEIFGSTKNTNNDVKRKSLDLSRSLSNSSLALDSKESKTLPDFDTISVSSASSSTSKVSGISVLSISRLERKRQIIKKEFEKNFKNELLMYDELDNNEWENLQKDDIILYMTDKKVMGPALILSSRQSRDDDVKITLKYTQPGDKGRPYTISLDNVIAIFLLKEGVDLQKVFSNPIKKSTSDALSIKNSEDITNIKEAMSGMAKMLKNLKAEQDKHKNYIVKLEEKLRTVYSKNGSTSGSVVSSK